MHPRFKLYRSVDVETLYPNIRARAGTETVRTVKIKSTVTRCCWCCCPGSVSRGNVFAPLYLLENPRGMRSRISLACLGDAGVYSVLVAYTQLRDSGVA